MTSGDGQGRPEMSAAYCLAAPRTPLHGPYHDEEYGFPARDEAVLFERLILEINQAGKLEPNQSPNFQEEGNCSYPSQRRESSYHGQCNLPGQRFRRR